MPSLYLKDLGQELAQSGEERFLKAHPEPVLVLLGLARALEGKSHSEATMMAGPTHEELQVTSLVGRVFPLCKTDRLAAGPITVGRAGDVDVCIPEYSISKKHCAFVLAAGTLAVQDLGATNGTIVDGEKLAKGGTKSLTGGEQLTLGRFAFRFDTPRSLLERLQKRAALGL